MQQNYDDPGAPYRALSLVETATRHLQKVDANVLGYVDCHTREDLIAEVNRLTTATQPAAPRDTNEKLNRLTEALKCLNLEELLAADDKVASQLASALIGMADDAEAFLRKRPAGICHGFNV